MEMAARGGRPRDGEGGFQIVDTVATTLGDVGHLDDVLVLELLCAHLLGLETAIRAVWRHVVYADRNGHLADGMCAEH
jgi:hypothetical protein